MKLLREEYLFTLNLIQMNKNKKIIEELKNMLAIKSRFNPKEPIYGEENRRDLERITGNILKALEAKDNKHGEETREIVEGIPCREMKCCDQDDCPAKTVWSFIRGIERYKDHIKDKYNLN